MSGACAGPGACRRPPGLLCINQGDLIPLYKQALRDEPKVTCQPGRAACSPLTEALAH